MSTAYRTPDIPPVTFSAAPVSLTECDRRYFLKDAHGFVQTVDSPHAYALAHEGRMVLGALSPFFPEGSGVANTWRQHINSHLTDDSAIHAASSVGEWAKKSLVPAKLFEETRTAQGILYRPRREMLGALALVALYDEVSQQGGDKSIIAYFSAPRSRSGTRDSQTSRITLLRHLFKQTLGDSEITKQGIVGSVGLARASDVHDLLNPLVDQGIVEVRKYDPAQPTTVKQGTHYSPRVAKHAKTPRRVLTTLLADDSAWTEDEIQAHLVASVEEWTSYPEKEQRRRTIELLQEMEATGIVERENVRFNDGVVDVKFIDNQLDVVGLLLEGLDKYAANDPVFMRKYGSRGVDIAHDTAALTTMYTRLATRTNNLTNTRKENVQDRVLQVLRSAAGPLSALDIAACINDGQGLSGDARPASRVQVRDALRVLQTAGQILGNDRSVKTYTVKK